MNRLRFSYPGKMSGVALEDQVAAVLRDAAPLPLSTSDVCAPLGVYGIRWATCGHDDVCNNRTHWRGRDGERYSAQTVRPVLIRLEKRGLVERHAPYGKRVYFWRWIGEAT